MRRGQQRRQQEQQVVGAFGDVMQAQGVLAIAYDADVAPEIAALLPL